MEKVLDCIDVSADDGPVANINLITQIDLADESGVWGNKNLSKNSRLKAVH